MGLTQNTRRNVRREFFSQVEQRIIVIRNDFFIVLILETTRLRNRDSGRHRRRFSVLVKEGTIGENATWRASGIQERLSFLRSWRA
jgi:hypothetical protein